MSLALLINDIEKKYDRYIFLSFKIISTRA